MVNTKKSKEYYQIALQLTEENKYSEAMKYYDKMIFEPNNTEYYINKAYCLSKLKKYESALEYCKKAINSCSDNIESKNKIETLKESLEKAIANEYYEEALKLEKEEKYEKAIKVITKALKLNPNNNEYLSKLEELKKEL